MTAGGIRACLRPETQTTKQRQERHLGWGCHILSARSSGYLLISPTAAGRQQTQRLQDSRDSSRKPEEEARETLLPFSGGRQHPEPRDAARTAAPRLRGPAQSAPSRAQALPILLLREPRAQAAPTHSQSRGRRTEHGRRRGSAGGAGGPGSEPHLPDARSHLPPTSPGLTLLPASAQPLPSRSRRAVPEDGHGAGAESLEEPRQSCGTSQAPTISGEAQAAGREGGGGLVFKPSAVRGSKDGARRPHSQRTGARSPLLSQSGARACPEPLLSGPPGPHTRRENSRLRHRPPGKLRVGANRLPAR